MINRIISSTLILALSLQCLVKLGLITYYKLNIEYIVQELCENRARPELNCEGKCYLEKQLSDADQAEEQSKERIQKTELPVFLPSFFSLKLVPANKLSSKNRIPDF